MSVYFAHYSLSMKGRFESFFTAIPFLILILFVGLRVDAGYDYGSYVQVLESEFYFVIFEPVPLFYGYLANLLDIPQLFFILTAATLGVALFLFLNKEPSRHIYLALYFSMPFCLIDSLSVVRQFLAMSFFLAAYSVYPRQRFFALILFILGLLSHKTALIAGLLLLVLVGMNKFMVRYLATFTMLILLVVALTVYFSVPHMDIFNNTDSSSGIGIKGAAVWLLISLPFFLGIKRYSKYYSDPIALIAFIGLGVYFGLALYGYFVSRFFIFFAPFAALFLSRSYNLFLGKKAVIIVMLISITNTSFLLIGASKNPEFDFLNNYKFYPSDCINCNIRGKDGF
jgi:hypothetical protein